MQLYSIFHREGDAGDHHALLNSIGPLRWYLDTRLDLGCGLQPEEMHVLHVIVACGHVLPMRPPPPLPVNVGAAYNVTSNLRIGRLGLGTGRTRDND